MLSNLFIRILKYTLAGVGTVYVAFYLIKPYLDKSEKHAADGTEKNHQQPDIALAFAGL